MTPRPRRGEIWTVDLGHQHLGHEQFKARPCLVMSADRMIATGLMFVVPVTSSPGPGRVEIDHPQLSNVSYAQPEQLRSVSLQRFGQRIGNADPLEVQSVETFLHTLLDFEN